jgi:hypothetical protein
MSAVVNPYAPPRARVDDRAPASSEAEEIRQEHIKHEASIRSIGILYYLSGGLMVLLGGGLIVGSFATKMEALLIGLSVVYLGIGVLMLFVARGVRTLQSWARTTTIVLAAIGLLGFPVGTLINGYILYLMLAAKGKRIFEDDYKDIVEATPHIKYRTSVIVWIMVGLLLLAAIGIIAAVSFGRH